MTDSLPAALVAVVRATSSFDPSALAGTAVIPWPVTHHGAIYDDPP